jgi:hypothetical protein
VYHCQNFATKDLASGKGSGVKIEDGKKMINFNKTNRIEKIQSIDQAFKGIWQHILPFAHSIGIGKQYCGCPIIF